MGNRSSAQGEDRWESRRDRDEDPDLEDPDDDSREESSEEDEAREKRRRRHKERRRRKRRRQRRQGSGEVAAPPPEEEKKGPPLISLGLGLGGAGVIDLVPQSQPTQPPAVEQQQQQQQEEEEEEDEETQDLMAVREKRATDWTSVNDGWVICWSLIKCVVYVLGVAVAFFILGAHYSKVQCVIIEPVEFCLKMNRTSKCVPEHDSNCRATCDSGTVGCQLLVDEKGEVALARCLHDEFEELCRETLSCPDDGAQSLLAALRYVAVFLIFQAILEVLFALALSVFKSMHPEDFEHLSFVEKGAALLAKLLPQGAQLLWWLQLFLWGVLLYNYLLHSGECANARQDTDHSRKYALFKHAAGFAWFDLTWLLVSYCVGTYVRFRFPVRGQLYTPGDMDVKGFPLGLDCQRCRDDPELRCKACFNRCCRPCGIWLERCWRDRLKFGP